MSWYKEGSVNIEQGSNTVTGVGTKWTNPLIGVCAGQMLILKTANTIEICEIASVQSDTQLTLANQYSGASKTGVSYEIPTAPKVSIEALALRISEMLNYYQKQMDGWQSVLTGTGDITLTAPDGRVVTIKSQKALTEAINNTISATKTVVNNVPAYKVGGAIDASSISVNGQQINPILNHMWVIEHESDGRTDIASSGHQSCFTVRDNGLCGVWDSPRQRWRFLFDGDGNLVAGNVCANQDWYNLTHERQSGVRYLNTTGKPIMISISCTSGGLWVSKAEVARVNGAGNISVIVPNGFAYAFDGELVLWSELR